MLNASGSSKTELKNDMNVRVTCSCMCSRVALVFVRICQPTKTSEAMTPAAPMISPIFAQS